MADPRGRVVTQAVLGFVMAWSVFRDPLAEAFGWTIPEVTLAFTLNYLAFGFSAFAGGLWLTRVGPRKVALTAALLYGLGVGLASLSADRLWVLYLSFGLLGGLGRGLGYIVPVAVLVKWFPDRRGLATGLAAAGFAAGAVLGAPVGSTRRVGRSAADVRADRGDVARRGRRRGLGDAAASAGVPADRLAAAHRVRDAADDYTVGEAIRTPQWYALWAQIFLSGSVGLALVSQAAPMAQEITGISAAVAAALIGVVSLGNMAGRFCWACLSDASAAVPCSRRSSSSRRWRSSCSRTRPDPAIFGALACLVVFSFGGGLGAMPALAADYFGPDPRGVDLRPDPHGVRLRQRPRSPGHGVVLPGDRRVGRPSGSSEPWPWRARHPTPHPPAPPCQAAPALATA